MVNINSSVTSLLEVAKINRRDDIVRLMPIELMQVQNICITQGFQGDDDPLVPPN
jgi:hypothetical protein